ncbi:MAG: hypothetical protein ACRCT1_03095 [Microcoleaceae cyanobacterium]
MKYPDKTPYFLVAHNQKRGAVTQVGKPATIGLHPGETLPFILNEIPVNYANNCGSLRVD